MRISFVLAVAGMMCCARYAGADEIGDAMATRNSEKVRQLLAQDPALATTKTSDGSTLLHVAALWNDLPLATLLVKSGLNVNAANADGYTPLHYAARVNAVDVARFLLQAGASREAKTATGLIPLDIAVKENAENVVRLLVAVAAPASPSPPPAPRSEPTQQPVPPPEPTQQPAPVAIAAATATPVAVASVPATPPPPAPVSAPPVSPAIVPTEARFEDGEAAMKAGQLKRALDIFTTLLKNDPADERINLYYGLTCLSLKDYSRARLAFERVLQANPGNDRGRIELAQTHALQRQYHLATQEFETVLSHNPPKAVKENIEQYLRKMKTASNRWTASGRLDTGVFSDNNVNVGPDSQIISIAPIVFGTQSITELTLGEESKPTRGKGGFGSLSLSTAYDMGAEGGWTLTADGLAYLSLIKDMSKHDSLFCQASVGPQRSDSRTMVQMPVKVAHISSGHDPLMTSYGLAPVFAYAPGAEGQFQLLTSLSAERRDYRKLNDRDGYFCSASETLRYAWAHGKHSVLTSFAVMRDNTVANIYQYDGWSSTSGINIQAHRRATVYAQVKFADSDYAEKETLAPRIREDKLQQYLVGINSPLSAALLLDINYQKTSNQSSFSLYEYNRNVATVSMRYTF